MKVKVKVYGTLLTYVAEQKEEHELEVAEPVTAGELLKHLGIPEEEVWLLSVGKRQVSTSYEVTEGEELSIFPPVTGG